MMLSQHCGQSERTFGAYWPPELQLPIEAVAKDLPAKYTDDAGKTYLARTKLKNLKGKLVSLKEPYSHFHNAGCSEAQEGYGAVTSEFKGPFGKRVSLMLDCALLGFEEQGKPIFPCLYAVVESSTWKNDRKVGLYNKIPIYAQDLAGNEKPIGKRDLNPYYRPV